MRSFDDNVTHPNAKLKKQIKNKFKAWSNYLGMYLISLKTRNAKDGAQRKEYLYLYNKWRKNLTISL